MAVTGIVIQEADEVVQSKGTRLGCGVMVQEGLRIPFERTLFLGPGARVNWGLIEAGWRFLDRWEAAAPLLGPGILADGVGGPSEQERTRELVHDLRTPLYGCEMLFVRDGEAGRVLVDAWQAEMQYGDARLAFVRALYEVKPLFLALPAIWLREMGAGTMVRPTRPVRRSALVAVEIAPGQYVKCFAGEEQKVRKRIQQQRARRAERKE